MKIRSTAPDAYIIVFPYTSKTTPMGKPFTEDLLKTKGPIFLRTDLLSVQTTKAKGAKGTWNATLSPRLAFKELLQPGDWVMIFISDEDLGVVKGKATRTENPTYNSGPKSGFKMLGTIRSVRAIEMVDPGSGTRTLRYEISGDDFQSALEVQAYINPLLRPVGGAKDNPLIDSLVYFRKEMDSASTPRQMIEHLVELLLGKKEGLGNGILSAGGGKAGAVLGVPDQVAQRIQGKPAKDHLFVNLLLLKFQDKLLGEIAFQPQLGSMFSLWSMIETYSNRVLNELYTDLLPVTHGKVTRLIPTLVFRCIPFTSKNFKFVHKGKDFPSDAPFLKISDHAALTSDDNAHLYTSRFIGEDELFAINYGKSDAERFNFFYVSNNFASENGREAEAMNSLLGDGTDAGKDSQNPLGDANSVARHGLRPFFGSSNYLQNDDNAFIACNLIIRDMWHEAHTFDNGQCQLVGTREHIPVGTNIIFKDRGWIAHVESVGHSFAVSAGGVKNFRTNISFVRLQTIAGDPIDYAHATTGNFLHNTTAVKKNDGLGD